MAGGQAESAPRRRVVRHVRLVASAGDKRARVVTRTRAPGFSKHDRGISLASDSSRSVTLAPESTLARRFRGFIDPQPISDNAFEALRKPHLVALNMEPAATMPAAPIAAPETTEAAKAADTTASVAPTAKQDRVAPVAGVEQTVTRQAVLADALAAKPLAQTETAASPALAAPALASAGSQAASTPQVMPQAAMTEAPPAKPADEPGRFPVHKLVLALCGALGAASALRFIVRA